ncbi:MAG: glycoside hydrolase family 15 protein [Bacilli bacterium]
MVNRLERWLRIVGSVILTAGVTVAVLPVSAKAQTATQPTGVSTASLYLSNWQDMTGIWMASHLCQNDTNTTYGPRIGELHYSANWPQNQIVDYSGFFLDNSTGTYYDQINNFASQAWLNSNDELRTDYGNYGGTQLPINLQRNYVMPPGEPFMVVQYQLQNPNSSPAQWSVLDQIHLNNVNSNVSVSGSYNSPLDALIANMTASGQYYVALGALQTPTYYQVGNDSDSTPSDSSAGAWYQFNSTGKLADNSSLQTPNMDMAFQNTVTIPAGGTVDLYYYVTVRGSQTAVDNAASTAASEPGSYWMQYTAQQATNWLNKGQLVNTSDAGINTEFARSLLVIKNAQNPTLGTFPAATNPVAYGYKNWARDSSFDVMALDASGHYNSAANYWSFMATHQNSDGTFPTSWSSWDGSVVTNAISPEYDSLGLFLTGVWRHYQLTGNSTFLTDVWPEVQNSANWLMNNITSYGFVPADYSIWEENQEYNVWTQGWAVTGLYAAERMAQAEGDQALMDEWNGAAGTVLSAIQRSDQATNPAPGLWNASSQYYDRAVETNLAPRQLIDSSSNMLWAFGAIDYRSSRAQQSVNAIVNALSSDTYGIARYQGDTYYYTSPYSPCGDEANAAQPPWPQMNNWIALYDLYTGNSAETLARLQWDVATSAVGYMPQGEAVAQNTFTPIVSTMVEPYTASSFIVAALAYTGQFQVLWYPPEYNAGDYQTINVSTNVGNDLSQWSSVPYFVKRTASTPGGSQMAAVKRVFISNDSSNLYIRIDNMSGALTDYNTAPLWGVTVYTEDFNHSSSVPASADALYGRALDRPMNYLLARWSNANAFSDFSANGSGGWVLNHNVASVIAPQWDPATGTVELVVPIHDVASGGSASAGSWAYMDIGFVYQNPSTGQWYDNDFVQIHYRITTNGVSAIYGNVE